VSIGILGNKIGMTQIFDLKGNVIPVTVIKCGPCYITQIKSHEICGYNAIQLGYVEVSSNLKILTKPQLGHFTKANLTPFRYLKEYPISDQSLNINVNQSDTQDNKENSIFKTYEIGQKFTVDMFKIGQYLNISGLSIGKGNLGNIKRNNFDRGPMSHGSKHHRLQGSMGSGTSPGRVFPGKKMPGRSGMKKCTISGLEILDIDKKENLLIIKGSIPGKSGNLVSLTIKN
jgi:large subunit ribosomal protein L3